MAKNGSFPNEPSRRLDRILIKSEKFTPETSAIIGNKPVLNSKMIFPSDHFGVISSFRKIPENKWSLSSCVMPNLAGIQQA